VRESDIGQDSFFLILDILPFPLVGALFKKERIITISGRQSSISITSALIDTGIILVLIVRTFIHTACLCLFPPTHSRSFQTFQRPVCSDISVFLVLVLPYPHRDSLTPTPTLFYAQRRWPGREKRVPLSGLTAAPNPSLYSYHIYIVRCYSSDEDAHNKY
jgi:hypothetical protein